MRPADYWEVDLMSERRAKTACFTGHRQIPPGEERKIETRLRYILDGLIDSGYIYFGVGGSYGYDALVTKYLLDRRRGDRKWRKIKIIMVCPFKGYWSTWPKELQQELFALSKRVDKIVFVSDKPSKEAYLMRNRHLVDNSSVCISYCTKDTGGTAYTVKYANRKKVPVKNTSSYDIRQLR